MDEIYEHNHRFVWVSCVPKNGEIFYVGGSLMTKEDYIMPCSIHINDFVPIDVINSPFNCWPSIRDCTYNGEDFSFRDIQDLIKKMYEVEGKIR